MDYYTFILRRETNATITLIATDLDGYRAEFHMPTDLYNALRRGPPKLSEAHVGSCVCGICDPDGDNASAMAQASQGDHK